MGGGGGSRGLNPLYGVVNSSKIAELGLRGQEEPKCGRKKSICVQACVGRGQEWLQLEKKKSQINSATNAGDGKCGRLESDRAEPKGGRCWVRNEAQLSSQSSFSTSPKPWDGPGIPGDDIQTLPPPEAQTLQLLAHGSKAHSGDSLEHVQPCSGARGECWHCPTLQRCVLVPDGLPAPSQHSREPCTSRSCIPDTAHQPQEPRRALKRG